MAGKTKNMNSIEEDEATDKRLIGLYGEMRLAMELHDHGWQVYRAYIDEHVDFIIARYYCAKCKKFSTPKRMNLWKTINKVFQETKKTFPTDKCETCGTESLKFIVRFLQVKTSEGEEPKSQPKRDKKIREYSFHVNLKSNIEERSFYVWIAITKEEENVKKPLFYIFNYEEIEFDDLSIPSYQKSDNQKTTLSISPDGKIHNVGRKYNYDCFSNFFNNFDKLKEIKETD